MDKSFVWVEFRNFLKGCALNKFNKYDLRWMMSLFGTAVGAGILFLPIKAGVAGIWPVLVMVILAFPMTFLSHRALARFCNGSQKNSQSDITEISSEYFGFKWGYIITFLYFFAFFPACIMYGVGITNTIISFMQNQLGFIDVGRFWVCFSIISLMMFVMIFHEDIVIKVCEWLVYPLCLILLVFSLYLIPHWDFSAFSVVPSLSEFAWTILFALPVLAFAFEHTPAISTFSSSIQRKYGKQNADFKCNQILFYNAGLLLFFVMFFVFSCVMCLNESDFKEAASQNIPIVSYFANKLNEPVINYAGPVIAILAIATSFFGHYFGAREGINGLVHKTCTKLSTKGPNKKKISIWTGVSFYIVMLVLSYLNPSILGIIDTLAGPVIAAVLFLLPMVGIYKVKSLQKYQSKFADIFVFVFGLVTILTVLFKMI